MYYHDLTDVHRTSVEVEKVIKGTSEWRVVFGGTWKARTDLFDPDGKAELKRPCP